MREEAPALFEQQPDLLHHLTTLINPKVCVRMPGVKCRVVWYGANGRHLGVCVAVAPPKGGGGMLFANLGGGRGGGGGYQQLFAADIVY